MNGQMYQICCIAAAAKMALKTKAEISYKPMSYEREVTFQFLPAWKWFSAKAKVSGVEKWYEECLRKGMEDIKFLAPTKIAGIPLLGFSNTTESSLVCFYGKKVTYFTPHWEFDSSASAWMIHYTEHEWNNAPSGKPKFENNTEDFKIVLVKIEDFARRIEQDFFAEIFKRAHDVLTGAPDFKATKYNMPLPEMPEDKMRIFAAAKTADVFGAMGSWNDSPPYVAHEKGLSDEYNSLSAKLLEQVRLAFLYSINEW